MVKASGRKKRRFLPEKAEGKQLEATNSESGKMHHRTPWLTTGRHRLSMCQKRNGYLHNEEKAESILFSEVVQRYSGDEKVIRCQAPLTKLI